MPVRRPGRRCSPAGYSTFITGKWHNGAESVLRTFQQGKAVFLGGMGNPYKLPIQDISTGHKLVNPRESGEHSVKLFADAAIGFLKEQRAGEPFLCYVAFNCPHDPRLAPQAYRDRYNGREPPLPANFLPHHPFNNGELVNRDESLAPWPRTPEIVRQHLADYYSYIEFMDDQIARILSALELTGLKDNTIVVFTSDHGLAIGSHGLFGKQNLYDHSMHSPLIVAGPGIPKGQQRAAFCYLLDIFPTLGELAQVSAPREAKAVASQRCCGARPRRGEALSSPRMPAFSARARRPLEADRLSADQQDTALRLAERPQRDARPCRRSVSGRTGEPADLAASRPASPCRRHPPPLHGPSAAT